MLPPEVIATDNRLEKAESKASEALAKHRWHWTLDESNSERVPIREYAREVARSQRQIDAQAKGYANWIGDAGTGVTLANCIERARMGAETAVVAEAIAEARGIGIQQVRKTRGNEVRRMRDWAREKAESKGTSVEEEVHSLVEYQIRTEQADVRRAEHKERFRTFEFLGLEVDLDKARKNLLEALDKAKAMEWGDEEIELLTEMVGKIKALLGLIDMALTGTVDVDWDAELASITPKESG